MKKRVFITILMILMYMLLGSCNSCTSSSAQGNVNMITYQQDTSKKAAKQDTAILYFVKEDTNLLAYQDTVKKAVIKKEIKPMQIDTVWKMKSDSSYKQLEKTEQILKEQHRKIDSLLIIKKHK